MGYWQRHPKQEGRKILQLLHDHGWSIIDPPKYYKARCPCGHTQRQVHLTPSDPNYWFNLEKWAQRQPCWK